ncbi:hypothetical protein [Roseateles amylovorans]|uniref:DUF3325 domain-containing protein n=1 Tax=Roseateles amylovorans TaxID=2978473 RepID=A0ABY6ASM1_9BURK|nr:hypothetical protein [Roseateles amylovorans]UXH76229.1 hypothetical protein N4261_14240 [Roseateles amylovorans]
MSLLYAALAALAAMAFFLGSRHHRLRMSVTPARWRSAGWLLLLLAWAAAWWSIGFWSGGFAMLTAFMLVAVGLPYLQAWRRGGEGVSSHVG